MGEGFPFKIFKGEGVVFKPSVLMFTFKPLKWAIGFGNFKHFFIGGSFLMCKGLALFLRFRVTKSATKSVTKSVTQAHLPSNPTKLLSFRLL